MKGKRLKEFLKSKNGVALVAVMFILLIITLYIPVIFNLGSRAFTMSIKGTTEQRSSYFARSITEMAVAAFTKTYEELQEANDNGTINDAGNEYLLPFNEYFQTFLADVPASQKPEPYREMSTGKVYIYYKEGAEEGVKGSYNYTTELDTSGNSGQYLGEGECKITFDNNSHYYIAFTQSTNELSGRYTDIEGNPLVGVAGEVSEITSATYDALAVIVDAGIGAEGESSVNFTISKTDNQQIKFKTTAGIKDARGVVRTKERSCTVVLPTYPSKQGWLYFDGYGTTDGEGRTTITDGCNQVQFKPDMKTGRAVINYADAGVEDYESQPLQIYSCLGNMVINTKDIKDLNGTPINNGRDGSELVLGMNPRLNTTPDNDPYFNIIDGINAAHYGTDVQRDNFIAATATGAIQVDVPVNLMVNGLRGNRLGDGLGLGDKNESIYKVLMFQAPIICFNRNVDMMVSLYYNPVSPNARRMSTITLMAPANTPYSYYNSSRNKTVKAGKVFFAQDCYLWVINFGNNGSSYSSDWYKANETVWRKDKDFTKVKIANAGDVYYFNSEVEMETKSGESTSWISQIFRPSHGSGNYVAAGLPLTGWALETYYFENYYRLSTSNAGWWQIWQKTKAAIFGSYIDRTFLENDEDRTYKDDDLHFIGNIYDGQGVEFPQVDGFYTVWSD